MKLAAPGLRRAPFGTQFFEAYPEMVNQRVGMMSGYIRGRLLYVYGQFRDGHSFRSGAGVTCKL